MCSSKHVAIQPVLTSSRACAPAGHSHAQRMATGRRTFDIRRSAVIRCVKRDAFKQPLVAMTIDGGHACITPSHVFAHSHDPP